MDEIHHENAPTRFGTPHGFGDDSRSRFLRQRPTDRSICWLERSLDVDVVAIRALRGGSSSAVHAVRVQTPGGRETVILRRYVLDELNAEEPDIAEREARVLRLLESSTVEAPRLLAVDATGDDAGCPAIVMSRIPGRLDWNPHELEPWLRRLAGALPEIHSTPVTGDDGVQTFQPYAPESREAPTWMRDRRLWDRALDVFDGPPMDTDQVFVHRDYHPGNVLWRGSRVTGVVDWQSASVGPRSVDVFWCRSNLLGRFGLEIADRFVTVWEELSGDQYHPWAEAVMLVDVIDGATRRGEPARLLFGLEDLLARCLAELGV